MPAHSETAGSIILEKAHAASKMLNHADWNGLIRANGTPSDVDFIFDNNGSVIFGDLSIRRDNWDDIKRTLGGERWAYESVIKWGPHCAVICKHNVPPEMNRQINTLTDIERFQVMVWDFGPVLSPIYDGTLWKDFVIAWMNDSNGPLRIRRKILGLSVGLLPEKVKHGNVT